MSVLDVKMTGTNGDGRTEPSSTSRGCEDGERSARTAAPSPRPCPTIMFVAVQLDRMAEHVLVPYDGTPAARSALAYASERFTDVRLTLLYVMTPLAEYSRHRAFPGYRDDDEFSNEREKGDHLLAAATEEVPEKILNETALVVGDPGRAIVKYVDEHDIDHVVIGSHGRTGVARFLLGSTAETVVRRAAVPVTVVRPSS